MIGSKRLTSEIFTPRNEKLRLVALGGEMFPSRAVFTKLFHNAHASLRVFNIFGISEVSAWASLHEIDMARELQQQPTAKFRPSAPSLRQDEEEELWKDALTRPSMISASALSFKRGNEQFTIIFSERVNIFSQTNFHPCSTIAKSVFVALIRPLFA